MRRLLLFALFIAAGCTSAYAGSSEIADRWQTDGGVLIGVGGSEIRFSANSSGAIDFATILTLSCITNTQTLTGAAVNDPVACSWPAGLEDGLAGTCWISATNTVSYRLCNVTGISINPASATFAARVIR